MNEFSDHQPYTFRYYSCRALKEIRAADSKNSRQWLFLLYATI